MRTRCAGFDLSNRIRRLRKHANETKFRPAPARARKSLRRFTRPCGRRTKLRFVGVLSQSPNAIAQVEPSAASAQGFSSDHHSSSNKKAHVRWAFLFGGEGGIRTLDRGYLYTLSRRAPSTTRTPLLKMEVTHPATPMRPSPLLPLLPSGPGGVHSMSPLGDQAGHHRAAYATGKWCGKTGNCAVFGKLGVGLLEPILRACFWGSKWRLGLL